MSKYHITVTAEPETESYYGQFDNPDDILFIQEQLAVDNYWAWCHVTVSLIFSDFTVSDSLGCCSYNSEQDFIENSGYYDDIVYQLKQTVINAANLLQN